MEDIVAEITRLADTMPPHLARTVLISALLETVTERLHQVATKASIDPPPPDTIH
jgi:hypothetical protein